MFGRKHLPGSKWPFSRQKPAKADPLKRVVVVLLLVAFVLVVGQLSAQASHLRPTNVAVLTYKNDSGRAGQNTQESILTIHNVNADSFGKRMTYPVDGRVYAQPLFVPHLRIHGTVYNVVFVATEHDSVYAFDADQVSDPAPLWHTNFISFPPKKA